jgi:UDP-glucose 6-dehydrogenase
MPIYEPGLDALVAKNVEAKRLHFTDDLEIALEDVEAVFIAEQVARSLKRYAVNAEFHNLRFCCTRCRWEIY